MTALRSSFTTFIKAFKVDPGFLGHVNQAALWQVSGVKPDSAYLFNHVYEFFAHNASRNEIDRNQAVVLELRNDPQDGLQKDSLKLWNTFYNREHTLDLKDRTVRFRLEKGTGILSPTLIFVPLTGIVLLCFSVRLKEDDQELGNLLFLNYHLRVSHKGAVSSVATPAREHPNARESEEWIGSQLQGMSEYEFRDGKFTWSVNTLSEYLCTDFAPYFTDLSPARLQAFTYVSLKDTLEGKEFDTAFFRLRRVYSERYVPADSFLEQYQEVAQTFDKIVYGASVEGAVVLVKPDEGVFLQNYETTVVQRTIWTYILAFHQRMALISAAYDSNSLFRDNSEPSTEQLSAIVDRLTKLQLKGLFEEISHYSQQNDFYYLVYRNLRVDELFKEVKDEVDEINLMLTEKWRRNEARMHELEEKSNRRNQRKIEVLLALLIIPQIWFAVLSTNVDSWQQFVNQNEILVNVINSVIWMVILVGVARLFLLSKGERKNRSGP